MLKSMICRCKNLRYKKKERCPSLTPQLLAQRGTTYVEYFIVAAAVAAASVWFYEAGVWQGAEQAFRDRFLLQQDDILWN